MREVSTSETAVLREVARIAAKELSNDIDETTYFMYVYSEMLVGKAKVLVTEEGERLTSVAVVLFGYGVDGQPYVSVDFMWIDPHYPRLFLEYLKQAEGWGVKRILIPTVRNEEAFLRKFGKYGFRKKYVVFEKVM